MFIFDNGFYPQKIIKGTFMDVDLVIKLIVVLLIFLWLISQKALFNPLYLAFFSFHAFSRLHKKEKRMIAYLILEYCELHIGKSKRKPNLVLIDTRNKMNLGKHAGQYEVKTRTIKINDQYARSLFSLSRIILHEYAHHMQFMAFEKEDYQRIFDEPNIQYSNHPWEKQARTMEKDFWKACVEYVLTKRGYLN